MPSGTKNTIKIFNDKKKTRSKWGVTCNWVQKVQSKYSIKTIKKKPTSKWGGTCHVPSGKENTIEIFNEEKEKKIKVRRDMPSSTKNTIEILNEKKKKNQS